MALSRYNFRSDGACSTVASRWVKNDMSRSHEVTMVRDPHRIECVSSMLKITRALVAYMGSEQVGVRRLYSVLFLSSEAKGMW